MKKLCAFLLLTSFLFASSSGPTSGTGVGASWTNPTNVASSNDAYATDSIAGLTASDPLYIHTLGFAVTGTVEGIEATIERKCSANAACSTDSSNSGGIWLTKAAGTSQGTNKGSASTWTTTDVSETLGSSTDKWGSTWTAAEVNATGFGLVMVVYNQASTRTASVDYMAVTVYYTPAGAGSTRRVIISQTRTVRIPHA